ncbi:nucleotide exchange factor GrpE [Ereboglobus luteus]|uniref:Protein GrpE n=1 Tax=Ereboglobus luteus TaxID=1796921 RepID=A0A2U8E0L6_9BACT|nr:nucleotide exchange factor GrpE [Ereboglobus luteus]AWI08370.1 nucleotide exchange factor GrpE [Ereboglobus luteus]
MSEHKETSQNPAEAAGTEPNAAAPASQAEPAAENTGAKTQAASVEDQVAAAKKEAAANYDRYVRAVADLENFRRRTLREKDELRQYAASRVLEDMFPIIEALALGLDAAKKPGTEIVSVIEGMDMVLNQIKTTLGKHGLKEINPGAGAKFDPHQEEAIAMQPSADIAEGHVLQVFRAGYSLNGRVLRPASVVVSSGKPDEKNEPAQSKD